jgi:hypothetical protein
MPKDTKRKGKRRKDTKRKDMTTRGRRTKGRRTKGRRTRSTQQVPVEVALMASLCVLVVAPWSEASQHAWAAVPLVKTKRRWVADLM